MDNMKSSMPAMFEEEKQFSESMLRWLDEGDRLHEDPRHVSFAGESVARRPWKLWLSVVWVGALVVGGRFLVQRLSAGQEASAATPARAALVAAAPADSPSQAPATVPAANVLPATVETPVVAEAPTVLPAAAAPPPGPSPFTTSPAVVAAEPAIAKAKAAPVVATEEAAASPSAASPQKAAVADAVPESFDTLLARCREATGHARWGAARAACAAAQQVRPDSPDVLTRLAEIALNRGQERIAMRLASAALVADPGFADAYVIVGSLEQGANRNEQARAAYSRYLKLAPSGRFASDLRAILTTL